MGAWLRMYEGVLDDPCAIIPPRPFCWVNLLCLAKRYNGVRRLAGDIAFFALRISEKECGAYGSIALASSTKTKRIMRLIIGASGVFIRVTFQPSV